LSSSLKSPAFSEEEEEEAEDDGHGGHSGPGRELAGAGELGTNGEGEL
jgi:hypothetical protein